MWTQPSAGTTEALLLSAVLLSALPYLPIRGVEGREERHKDDEERALAPPSHLDWQQVGAKRGRMMPIQKVGVRLSGAVLEGWGGCEVGHLLVELIELLMMCVVVARVTARVPEQGAAGIPGFLDSSRTFLDAYPTRTGTMKALP